jgi:anti-anti-sigma factor
MNESIAISGQHQDHRTLELAGDINVFLAAELHRCCVKVSEGASSVEVDCNRITSLDVATIQILLALKDTLVARGGMMSISGLSAEVAETTHLAGLGKRLGIDCGFVTKGDAL